jgi:hypothetical protein
MQTIPEKSGNPVSVIPEKPKKHHPVSVIPEKPKKHHPVSVIPEKSEGRHPGSAIYKASLDPAVRPRDDGRRVLKQFGYIQMPFVLSPFEPIRSSLLNQ